MRRESSTVVALVGEVHEVLLAALARSPNVSVVRADGQGSAEEALRQATRRMTPFVLVAADPLAAVAAAWQAMWDLSAIALGGAAFEERAVEARAAWHAGRFELPDYYLVPTRPLAVPGDPGHGVRGGRGFHLGPLRSACPHRVEVVVLPGTGGQGMRDRQGATGRQGMPGRGTAGNPGMGGHGPHSLPGRWTGGGDGPAPASAAQPGPAPQPSPAGTRGADRREGTVGPETGRSALASAPAGADGPEQAARVLHALRSLRHGPWWPRLDDLIEAARHFYAGGLGEPGR